MKLEEMPRLAVEGLRAGRPHLDMLTSLPAARTALDWVTIYEPDLVEAAEDLVAAVHKRMVDSWINQGVFLGFDKEHLEIAYERGVKQFVVYG